MFWFPYVNAGPCLFVTDTAANLSTLPKAISNIGAGAWLQAFYYDYSTYFSQTCMVSASLSV